MTLPSTSVPAQQQPQSSTTTKNNNKTQPPKSSKSQSLFWSDTSGGLTPAGFLLVVIAIPLLILRKYILGAIAIAASITIALLQNRSLPPTEQLEIRYHILSCEDLMVELENIDNSDTDIDTCRLKYLEGLSALAKKYNRKHTINAPKDLPLWCQQIAYAALQAYPLDAQIVAGAVSLLALIAKDSNSRKRYKYQTDDYNLQRPIASLRQILEQAKATEDEEQELYLAEVLRKGCLFLGAVCNNDNDAKDHTLGLVTVIVQNHGGMELILEILNWFRCHEDVCNWALWAIFTMAFDQLPIKVVLVREQGIATICQTLQNHPTSLEVNRHGIALLFDLLRENPVATTTAGKNINNAPKWDPWEVRKMALVCGLHKVVYNAMVEFSDSMDIMMMGQEMLIGTGFQGNIPVYQQTM